MSYSKLINPKKKRRVFATKEAPFPVPIATVTREPVSNTKWSYFSGELIGDHVVVQHSGDMNFLYKMGFFGKGNLSRSKPDFNKRFRMAEISSDTGVVQQCRVMSRRSFIRRQNWKNREGGSKEEKAEYDSSQEAEYEETGIEGIDGSSSIHITDRKIQADSHINMEATGEETWKISQGSDLLERQHSNKQDWTTAVEEWDNTEADPDFWGDTKPTIDLKLQVSAKNEWENTDTNTDFWSDLKPSNDPRLQASAKHEWENTEADSKFLDSPEPSVSTKGETSFMLTDESSKYTDSSNFISVDSDSVSKPSTEQTQDAIITQIQYGSNKSKSHSEEGLQKDSSISSKLNLNKTSFSTNDKMINERGCKSSMDQNIDLTHSKSKIDKSEQKKSREDEEVDSLCEDEDCGNFFVIEDSDYEDWGKKRKWKEKQWKPAVKKDPYFVSEFLHLSLEESFFLAYGLGCLVVHEDERMLNLSSMWRIFCERQDRFLPKYIAYHYFRSKGWVPKSGLKFGADFIIYKEGPPFYHGSYSVVVRLLDNNLEEDPSTRTLTWTGLAGLNRLTDNVAKELMICYVIKPKNLNNSDSTSPKVINEFTIKEMVVSRWVSSQERENKTSEDMP